MSKGAVVAGIAAVLLSPASAPADDRADVLASYNAAIKKYAAKDMDGYFGWVAPDAGFKMSDGRTYTARETRTRMTQGLAVIRDVKMKTKTDALTAHGSTAAFNAVEESTASMTLRDGKPHKVHMLCRYRYTLAKVGGAWKLRKQDTIRVRAEVDGKPIQ